MLQRPAPRLILASESRSRRALLTAAGLSFEVVRSNIDEAAIKADLRETASATRAALRLAGEKAAAVSRAQPDALVIGADQILVCQGRWFDKPANRVEAREQLRALRGQSHILETAVACCVGGRLVWSHVASPNLEMRGFSEVFLESYLNAEGDAILGSVGAYRLEGLGIHLFGAVRGEHAAILGLPLLELLRFLREYGVLAS